MSLNHTFSSLYQKSLFSSDHAAQVTMAKHRGSSIELEPTHLQGPSAGTVSPELSNRPLQVNLFITNITVWLMFVVGGIVIAFALLAMDELRYEYIY